MIEQEALTEIQKYCDKILEDFPEFPEDEFPTTRKFVVERTVTYVYIVEAESEEEAEEISDSLTAEDAYEEYVDSLGLSSYPFERSVYYKK